MTTSPAADITAVRRRLVDEASTKVITDDEVDEAIQAAVARYSKDRPLRVTEDVTGNDTGYYVRDGSGAVLTEWVEGWSWVIRLEYPAAAVSATHDPDYLDPEKDLATYRDASKVYFWLPYHTPASTETLRFTFAAPRTLTDASDTIVTEDKDALYALSTAYALMALANAKAGTIGTSIQANAVDYKGASGRYKDMADKWMAVYESHMGLGDALPPKAASRFVDWDFSTRSGRRRLTH